MGKRPILFKIGTNSSTRIVPTYIEYIPVGVFYINEKMTKHLPSPDIEFLSAGGCNICGEFHGKINIDDKVLLNALEEQKKKIKITRKIVDRAIKPIRGIFFGKRNSKSFRSECERLSRDLRIRNCGTGVIIRKALKVIAPEILNEPFTKTEELQDVLTHVSPCKNCR